MSYDVYRHVRQWPKSDPCEGERDGKGRFTQTLPQLHKMPADPSWSQLCACGVRRGLHRYATEQCPNQQWKTGNGELQWLEATFEHRPMGRSTQP